MDFASRSSAPGPRFDRWLACLCLLLLWLPASAARSAQPADDPFHLRLQPIEFEARSGERVTAERGTFRVPERRADPESRTLELAFVRFASTAEEPGPPIVYLAGGPGGSGIDAARGSRFELFMALRELGDLIAFDQRGTGESEPDMACGDPYRLPPDRPLDREAATAVLAGVAGECTERLAGRGIDLAGYTTNESADDVDALRRALGAEKLTLVGISYGSHLGLAVLRRHGEHIERAVLAGVEPLHHTFKLPADQQRQLERIAELVRRDQRFDGEMEDLVGSIRGLLARLEEEPAVVPLTHPLLGEEHPVAVGPFDLQLVLAGMLRGPEQFRALPESVARMVRGDFVGLALSAGRARQGEMRSAMSLAMDCSSGMGESWARRIEREARSTLLADAINYPFPEICRGVDVPDAGDAFRAPVRSEVPVLLISGSLDGRTPPSNAEEVLPHLENGSHLVVEGTGHGAELFMASPKIGASIRAFLSGRPLPHRRIELPPVELIPPRRVVSVPGEVLERSVGTYRIDEDAVRRVFRAGDLLWTQRDDGPVLPIRPLSETEFFYEGSATYLRFQVDDDGKVTGMVMHHDGAAEGERAIKVE